MIPIVVTTYKNPERLHECLSYINRQTIPCKTIVVDNTEINLLYTRGMNKGIRMALDERPEYICILTDDGFLETSAIEHLKLFLDQNQEFGIASPMQVFKNQITWCGSLRSFPFGQHDQRMPIIPRETPWANGTCMLLRTKMIREIGLMDENMQFICSDSDYSFTARSRGWKVAVVPNALVEHRLNESGEMGKNLWIDQIKMDDVIYFTRKWLSGDLFKSLEYDGDLITNGVIKNALYSFQNTKKKIASELKSQAEPAASPLSLGQSNKSLGLELNPQPSSVTSTLRSE